MYEIRIKTLCKYICQKQILDILPEIFISLKDINENNGTTKKIKGKIIYT